MSAEVNPQSHDRVLKGPVETDQLCASLFSFLEIGVVLQSSDGSIRDANPAAEQILGLSIEQLQGRTSIDPRWRAVHEDHSDFPGEDHPAMRVIATGQGVHNVIMGVFSPREEAHRWILIDSNPLPVNGENWAVTTFTDITDLKMAHESMKSFINSVNQHTIVSMTDREGTITHANDAFSLLSGYTRDELIGQNHRMLKSGRHSAAFYEELWATVTSGKVWRGEVCNMRQDGSLYWVAASISPLYDMLGHLTGYVSVRTDVSAQKDAEQAAEIRSRLDPLTGLANRRHFDDQLHLMSALSAATAEPLALVLMDVDRFKLINDLYGHAAGDEVLRALAAVIDSSVPKPSGLAARWGGEEFAVLLPGCGMGGAVEWITAFWRALQSAELHPVGAVRPSDPTSGPIAVTVSAGLAVAHPSLLHDPEEIVRLADQRLYEAKRRGRNQWVGPPETAGSTAATPPAEGT
jgi:diguanylate cyclase (GGDEF)-like protein/PAS domain S-box-containing protein